MEFYCNFVIRIFTFKNSYVLFVHFLLIFVPHYCFQITENRFEFNQNFRVSVSGYYAFVNISSNNFTDNWADNPDSGIVQVLGMEKRLIVERNRFLGNWGRWMFRIEALSQSLRFAGREVVAQLQFNYFQFNHFLRTNDEYTDMWPRSYTVGVFGVQLVQVST